ncbi:MAG: hypothetical protein AB7O43_09005 [Hyphomicrobiaceae bacterium]
MKLITHASAILATVALTAAGSPAAMAQLGGKPTPCLQPGDCGGTTRPGGVEAKPGGAEGIPSGSAARSLRSLRSAKPPLPGIPSELLQPSPAPTAPPAPAVKPSTVK